MPHADGGRAIDQDSDWVRREIVEALAFGVRVVPVLVGGARRLTDAPLPNDIAAITTCQHIRLRPENMDEDLGKLVASVRRLVPQFGSVTHPITMKAHAEGNARVYQAGRDLTINEHG